MRVLQVHNRYRLRGGEDAVVDATMALLAGKGVEARLFARDSGDMGGIVAKARGVFTAIHSGASARALRAEIRAFQPDVVHVHNVFPILSPAVFAACAAEGVPAVMTVHNYRLTCPIGVHFTRGVVCTQCAGGHEYRCATRNCRGGRFESAAYALRGMATRAQGGFTRHVSAYIAISAFLKAKLVASGLPADKIHVVHNMASTPDTATDAAKGEYALFCGRLSEEKGLDVLLEAARLAPEVPVRIAGDGELRAALEKAAPRNVSFTGLLDRASLQATYAGARFAVVPSVWWETFGLVAVEAMGHGLPVIAARSGALPEIVLEGETGLLVPPGDAPALAAALMALWADPQRCATLGAAARARAVEHFNRDKYFQGIMDVYTQVIGEKERT
jgi:glycosyltransferase involved in cell wall biosynthesis